MGPQSLNGISNNGIGQHISCLVVSLNRFQFQSSGSEKIPNMVRRNFNVIIAFRKLKILH